MSHSSYDAHFTQFSSIKIHTQKTQQSKKYVHTHTVFCLGLNKLNDQNGLVDETAELMNERQCNTHQKKNMLNSPYIYAIDTAASAILIKSYGF